MVTIQEAVRHSFPGVQEPFEVSFHYDKEGRLQIGRWDEAKLGPRPTMEELEARAKDLPPPPPPPPTIEERLAKLETDVSTLKGAKI